MVGEEESRRSSRRRGMSAVGGENSIVSLMPFSLGALILSRGVIYSSSCSIKKQKMFVFFSSYKSKTNAPNKVIGALIFQN